MKKLLYGTTALVGVFAVAGAASQAQAQSFSVGGALDVTISANSTFDVEYTGDDLGFTNSAGKTRNFFFNQDHEIELEAIGVGDATGIEYGFNLQIENAGGDGAGFDEAYMFFAGNFGEVQLGDEDGVVETLAINGAFVAAGTAGIDGDMQIVGEPYLANAGEATKITYYTPNVAGFQAGLSFALDAGDRGSDAGDGTFEEVLEFGANYQGSFGGVDVGLYAAGTHANSDDYGANDFAVDASGGTGWTVGGLLGFFGVEVAASYSDEDEEGLTERLEFDDFTTTADADVTTALQGLSGVTAGTAADLVVSRDNTITAGIGTEFAGVAVSFTYHRDSYEVAAGGFDPTINRYIFGADTGLLPGVALAGEVGYAKADLDVSGVDERDGVNAMIQLDVSF